MNIDRTTYGVPRLLAFIELAYLYESLKIAEKVFDQQINDAKSDRDKIGNINATKQSLYRSIFISAFATLEQNLDELCIKNAEKENSKERPNNLRERGINRSIKFYKKTFSANIDKEKEPWLTIFQLNTLRNHLVHYGPDFSDSEKHSKLYESLKNFHLVSLRSMICFDEKQLEEIFELMMKTITVFMESTK